VNEFIQMLYREKCLHKTDEHGNCKARFTKNGPNFQVFCMVANYGCWFGEKKEANYSYFGELVPSVKPGTLRKDSPQFLIFFEMIFISLNHFTLNSILQVVIIAEQKR